MVFLCERLINWLLNVIIYIENRGDILDLIIIFFRDVLDGPLYIVVAIICGILICSCIGYLGEQYLNSQKERKEYEETHAALGGDIAIPVNPSASVVSGEATPTVVVDPNQVQ